MSKLGFQTSRHFTARGVRPHFSARTNSDARAFGYVRAGMGVTVMPDCFHAEGIMRPHPADFHVTHTIGLIYGAHLDPSHAALLTEALEDIRR